VSSSLVVRCLERAVKDSEALDLESLCVLAGERVWRVSCDVLLADFDGNALDACCLATVGFCALPAHNL
jgi:exosome complex RNA-binding protein Rrp42 (RNase PH superfamily)